MERILDNETCKKKKAKKSTQKKKTYCVIGVGQISFLRATPCDLGAHHQLGEEVNEVLRGQHHRGVERNHKAGPQGQVQVGRQLLLGQKTQPGEVVDEEEEGEEEESGDAVDSAGGGGGLGVECANVTRLKSCRM